MLIHELVHLILSFVVALIGYRYWRSAWVWVASFAAGFLVDADHLLDYFIYRRGLNFNFAEFASGSYFDVGGKIYLFFHSYEIIIICLIAAACLYLKRKNRAMVVLLAAFAISLIFHLLYDTYYYKPDWQVYFLSTRLNHHFNIQDFHFH